MSLEINYIDAPEGAQDDMTAESAYGSNVSQASAIAEGSRDVPFATLEPGVWKLDGSRRILPDAPEIGWWSRERSGDDGRFENPPTITLRFPVPYSSTGFTLTFSPSTEQWCAEIRVSWYNGQNLILEKTFYPDGAGWILNETVESFDQVRFQLLRTNHPGHFAKIQRIEIGRTILFGAGEISSVRLVNEVDPSLCVLTADTMNFEIVDSQDRELIPQENQKVELIKNGKVHAVQYIVSSTREAKNQHKITCQSVIGLLEDTFLGGLFVDVPLENLAGRILGQWPFEIDANFQGVTVTGYLPVCTQREALQQLAFAVGAVISTQGGNKIRFLPVPSVVTAKFSESEVFLGGSVKTSPRVAKVQVTAHAYTAGETEQVLIRDEEMDGEDILVTFDAPHHSYAITGGVITGSDVNWVTITASGKVTLTGKDYTNTSVVHTKRNPAAVAKEQSNYISVHEVTLVNSNNVKQALERLFSVYQLRQVTEQEVVITDQRAGEMAVSVTPWGSKTRGFISSMDSEMTQGGHTAVVNFQGVEVELESVWVYSGELWSGDSEVLY